MDPSQLNQVLSARLDALRTRHLRRVLKPWVPVGDGRHRVDDEGRAFLDFASNDYLGLAWHPDVRAAAVAAVGRYGGGSTASRLITGTLDLHRELDLELAAFKRLPSALGFSTGHATAVGTLPALVGPGDFVLLDRLSHACLVDGARLSGARLRVWRHNDVADLGRLLRWVRERGAGGKGLKPDGTPPRTVIVTESVFSMDGDVAPLREIVECRDASGTGAWLMVDEAHATGVLGPGGRGWIEALGLTGQIEVTMGTLGKALGAGGGFIAGSSVLVEYLVHAARSFLFSTAPVPAAVAAALAALRIAGSGEGDRLRSALWERVRQLHGGLVDLGWEVAPPASPILPLRVGDEAVAVAWAAALRSEGIVVPAIRFPTVPRGQARLRVTLSAVHRPEDIERLLAALRRVGDSLRGTGTPPG